MALSKRFVESRIAPLREIGLMDGFARRVYQLDLRTCGLQALEFDFVWDSAG